MIEFENEYVKANFNLDEVIAFQNRHDVQILREADYSYHVYIDKKAFGTALTPLCALALGIKAYKQSNSGKENE